MLISVGWGRGGYPPPPPPFSSLLLSRLTRAALQVANVTANMTALTSTVSASVDSCVRWRAGLSPLLVHSQRAAVGCCRADCRACSSPLSSCCRFAGCECQPHHRRYEGQHVGIDTHGERVRPSVRPMTSLPCAHLSQCSGGVLPLYRAGCDALVIPIVVGACVRPYAVAVTTASDSLPCALCCEREASGVTSASQGVRQR